MTSQDQPTQPNTVAVTVYKQIRRDIINGVFPPGAHLVKRVLAKKYGVSVPPIIEACLRLEGDGLVETSPLAGAFVSRITPEKIEEEHFFREAIECQIARVYAIRVTELEREVITQLAKTLDEFERDTDLSLPEAQRTFQKMHSDFHVTIAKYSKVKLLYEQLRKVWFRYLMFIWNGDKTTFPTPPRWHEALADALHSGDQDIAEAAMRNHFNVYRNKKMASISGNGHIGESFFDEILSDELDSIAESDGGL